MSDVQRRLLDGGVSEKELEQTLDDIEETAQILFSEQGETLEDEEALEKIQSKILNIVVELGEGAMESQFDRLIEDFSDPDSSRARTNVVYAIGSLASSEDSLPPALAETAGDIIADNHA